MFFKFFNFPIYSILIGLLAGILLGYYQLFENFDSTFFIALSAVFFLIGLLIFKFIKNISVLLNLIFFISLGFFLQQIHYQVEENNRVKKLENTPQNIVGYLTAQSKNTTYNYQYFLNITHLNNQPTNLRVLLKISNQTKLSDYPKPYDVLMITDAIEPIPFQGNLYGFNYQEFLKKKGYQYQISIYGNNFKIIGQQKNLFYQANQVRLFLEQNINQLNISQQSKAIMKALTLGQKSDIDQETYKYFSQSGAIHLLAISGLHVGIILIFLNIFFGSLWFLKGHDGLKSLLIILCLWFFALLTGFSPSVSRAVLMFSFFVFGYYQKNQVSVYNHLANSMVVLMIIKPHIIFDVGFQLSYAAVFAIVSLNKFFRQWEPKQVVVKYFYQIVVVSFAAQLGVFPIALYYFNQFPGLFLVSNLFAIPMVTIILFLSFLMLLLSVFNFTFEWINLVYDFLISLMYRIIQHIGSLEDYVFTQVSFNFSLLIASYILIFMFINFVYRLSFQKILIFSFTLLGFYVLYQYIFIQHNSKTEFIVFNQKKENLYLKRHHEVAYVYTNIQDIKQNRTLQNYFRGSFCKEYKVLPIKNFYEIGNTKILLINQAYFFDNLTLTPEIIIVSNNPKVNFEQLIKDFNPKKIIADGTNSKTNINRWQKTCQQYEVAFASTYDSGYEKIGY